MARAVPCGALPEKMIGTMRPTLSQQDVEGLLTDPSPANREQAAAKIATDYAGEVLTDDERTLAEEIFRLMVQDAEVRVRQALSFNLKDFPGLSHEIAVVLASDIDAVSIPLLRSSVVLTDEDLIDIVKTQGTSKQTAVAQRATVSEALSDALIKTHSEEVVSTLVGNVGANISEGAMTKVLDEFGESETIHRPLALRGRLPVVIAERLVHLVSETLREHIVTHHEMSTEVASELILQARERATVGLLSPTSDGAEVSRLVEQLHASGRLTPTIILRALCVGDIAFFEASIALLAGVPLPSARQLIYDRGGLGLGAIARRAGLPEELDPVFKAAVDVAAETDYDGGENDRQRFRRTMIERILTLIQDPNSEMGAENAEFLLTQLARTDTGIEGGRPSTEDESEPSAA
jgi:uncharacterized protein (DUF2336 family)